MIGIAIVFLVVALLAYLSFGFTDFKSDKAGDAVKHFAQFAYSCFFKPHTGDGSGNQQDALESFYKSQANIYDATRSRLLQGREDMLALLAAQVKHRVATGQIPNKKPIWVDIGGGTGWNIEQMGKHIDIPTFFHAVYLVDLSTSLCEVAKKRFERLGWTNVHVICEDARVFRLQDYEAGVGEDQRDFSIGRPVYDTNSRDSVGADVLTMSYSLSMIPGFHPVVDSVANLLSPTGLIGLVDFYVQNKVEFAGRNYIGGSINRHCMFISRVFWRAWFELDRVNLDSARRDYIEYKFGTILSTNRRCHLVGFRIPYYIFIGCTRSTASSLTTVADVDAAVTESPFINALDVHARNMTPSKARRNSSAERRSKAYEHAIINLTASLPLPAAYYQNNKTRIYYDATLQKHTQFGEEYIYAFTWEDSKMDARLLKVNSDDVILAITSAGDNILSYALERPKRIHAVDLNPNQNHLLELKVASFRALGYADMWKMFGEGKHADFERLLIDKLSPHMSSHAFDYWLHHGPSTFGPKTGGLYHTGGSRYAIKLVALLGNLLGIRGDIRRLTQVSTLAEQREIWHTRVRRVLLSELLAYFVIGTEVFLWKALGVPSEQRAMIEEDYKLRTSLGSTKKAAESGIPSGTGEPGAVGAKTSGNAIWQYGIDTLDAVANDTLIGTENHYYLVCLLGHYLRRCHPDFLSANAHQKLSQPGALDNVRIHTEELKEVFAHMQAGALTIAVLMDSMDWFKPTENEAEQQVKAVNRALKLGGRVLIRSSGGSPWYMKVFEENGFSPKRVALRDENTPLTDRVNMYKSTWICTKNGEVSAE